MRRPESNARLREMLDQHYARAGDVDGSRGTTGSNRRKRRGTRAVGASETRRERAHRHRQRQRQRERDRERNRELASLRIHEAAEAEATARAAQEEADAVARALRAEAARFGRTESEQAMVEADRYNAAREWLRENAAAAGRR